MIDDVLEFLHDRESASLDEFVMRFAVQAEIAARIEVLLLHLLHRGLICEPREFNRFELTDAGRDRLACSLQERARMRQRRFIFEGKRQ